MIHFQDMNHGLRIAQAAGVTLDVFNDVCISRTENGKLMGGVIYEGYTGRSMMAHTAGFHPRWVCKDLLWAAFHYPFVQSGCDKLFGQVPSFNSRALEFDLKLGFKEVARIPDVFENGDLLVLCMTREDCRWLKLRPRTLTEGPANGREVPTSSRTELLGGGERFG